MAKVLINKYFKNKSIFTLEYKNKSTENEYKSSIKELKFIQMRYAPFFTLFFYLWLFLIDFALATPEQLKYAQPFHLTMVFILLTPFIASFFKSLHKIIYFALLLSPICSTIGNIFLLKIGMIIFLPDIYLIIIWVFIMPGFYFYQSFIRNIIIIIITAISYLSFDILSIYHLELHIIYILISFVIGMFASYYMEFTNRINFESNNLLAKQQDEIKIAHKQIKDSIEYASLIQRALIPLKGTMNPYFKDHFVTWIPKDKVGGDIWLFNDLRHKDECLLFLIDCTGHGVPGALVTMIVKAVEREITTMIRVDKDMDISPAWIMRYFNRAIKQLLRQETKDSLSNAGWDGGIIYYNKRTQILKFAGAETPLFYIDENKEFKTIKGNRYSVGYKKCSADYEYKETIINVKEGMKFYCTTDGYLDQNGGEKDFPFGKKRFTNIIKKYHTKPMKELQDIFTKEMMNYEAMVADNDRNDDMTLIAFEIDKN